MVTLRLMWGLLVLCVVAASPRRYTRQAELDNYDNNNVDLDLNVDGDDVYDYYDGIDEPQIEIGTLSPDEDIDPSHHASLEEEEEEEELPIKPQLIPSGSGESGTLMGPSAQGGMATCMLCTCLVGSVYCDDLKLDRVPPLSKETTHFYARYNKIARISKSDFANLNKLNRIDLTSNGISRIDDDAFFGLPALEELILRENSIRQLPALPPSMTLIDASHNQLGSTGIQREAFKDMPGLLYLYLTDNNIDHIPVPLPDSLRSLHLQNNNIQMMHEDTFCNPHDLNYIRNALEDVRLDGNPINLSRTPQAYICLPRIPVGALI
uniref:Fibril-forming collagen alpha chain-like n=1 Tax=Sinocyclocheilus rhinocerous TaxID=307959 RepID=A0A673I013_9TELE